MRELDLESRAFRADPWPTYAWFREHDPIHWSPRYRSFFLFRYEHIRRSLETENCLVSHPFRATRQALGASLLDLDGDDHRRLRAILSPRFKARATEAFATTAVASVVEASLDRMERSTEVELVRDLAFDVPLRVTLRLLGAPEGDTQRLCAELRPIVDYIDDPRASLAAADAARESLDGYCRNLLRTTLPEADTVAGDLVRALDLGRIDEDEAARLLVMLLAAATETTAAAIANLFACVLARAGLVERVAEDAEFARAVVTETLRWEPPLHSTLRVAGVRFELAGIELQEGTPVQLMLASGNRDPLIYENPDEWKPGRDFPRPLLSFGAGSHHCMGFGLAHAELVLLLRRFCQRFPECRLLHEVATSGRTFRRPAELRALLG
jgi:cytochrome P450